MESTSTSTAYDAAIKYAADLGAEHGRNAAEWYRSSWYSSSGLVPRYDAHGHLLDKDAENARRILRGIEDGDPAVFDTFPGPDLSGEWADSLTGPQLAADAVLAAGVDIAQDAGESDEWSSDICDAYETAFSDAVSAEIERAARAVLA